MTEHKVCDFDGVPTEILTEVLNTWPPETIGYYRDVGLIALLNDLCKEHGYGFVPQLCNWIEDIWRNPEKVGEYRQMRADRIELLKLIRK